MSPRVACKRPQQPTDLLGIPTGLANTADIDTAYLVVVITNRLQRPVHALVQVPGPATNRDPLGDVGDRQTRIGTARGSPVEELFQ